jgi:hypothetical protein
MVPLMLGAPELLIILLMVIGPIALVLTIVVVIDASGRPDAAWQATGQSRTMWIVLPIVLLLACGIGSIVACIIYLASVRPKLVRSVA